MPERKRCPPFCDDTCDVTHDKFIVCLINMQEGDRKSYERFKGMLHHYHPNRQPEEAIQDPIREYRHPLLHWASVLGKVSAVNYLIKKGYQPDIRSQEKGETALHRVVLCLYRSMEKYRIEKQSKRFENLTELLAPALFVQDDNGNTPLHSCAVYITTILTGAQSLFYRMALRKMIAKVVDMEERGLSKTDGLNIRNKEGKTILHILASSKLEYCVELVGLLLDSGADPEIRSFEGKSAFDIAEDTSKKMVAEVTHLRSRKRKFDSSAPNGAHSASSSAAASKSTVPAKRPKHSGDQNLVTSTSKDDIEEKDLSETASSESDSDNRGKMHKVFKRKGDVRPSLVSGDVANSSGISSQNEHNGAAATVVASSTVATSPVHMPYIKQETSPKASDEQKEGSTDTDGQRMSSGNTPRLEILLKKTNQQGLVLNAVEENRKQLEADCMRSDKILSDHTATKTTISKDCLSIEKEIKTKEEELAKLKNKLMKRKQDMKDIKMKITDEEASRERMAEKLGDYENIIKLFHSV